MRASEIMIADPVVAAAGATSAEVASLMRVRNISVVPVIDNPKDRRCLGTISDRDIVTGCVGAGHDPQSCSAQNHLHANPTVVSPETEMKGFRMPQYQDAADHHVRATIVVVDKAKAVVGFIPHPEEIAGIVRVP